MSRGPLRRLTGFAGLAALIPTSVLLATGSLTPVDAAARALATLVLVLVVGRVAERSLAGLLAVFEREAVPTESDAPERPRRRDDATQAESEAVTRDP